MPQAIRQRASIGYWIARSFVLVTLAALLFSLSILHEVEQNSIHDMGDFALSFDDDNVRGSLNEANGNQEIIQSAVGVPSSVIDEIEQTLHDAQVEKKSRVRVQVMKPGPPWLEIKTVQFDDTTLPRNKIVKDGKPIPDCGCPATCDYYALYGKPMMQQSCGDRIKFLMDQHQTPEIKACEVASSGDDAPCGHVCKPSVCKEIIVPEEDVTMDTHDPPFQRYDNVVITTKVHWSENLAQLKRMMCLLKAAYNRFVNYDILVFTTIPWTDEEVEELAKVVAPAKLIVAIDGPPLEGHLASMTKEEVDYLVKRCSVEPNENITWFHHCKEENVSLIIMKTAFTKVFTHSSHADAQHPIFPVQVYKYREFSIFMAKRIPGLSYLEP